ncbi:MAG: CPBP family intramembrane metalloprotease [Candidatus Zixiibacteriota bacterium]|nr:MAG: CPBP family intramembrane metalloprotease [candidate division Zixibacteria bacterium]
MNQEQYERLEVYQPPDIPSDPFERFKERWGNSSFRVSTMTWVSLFILIVGYPGLTAGFTEDPTEILRNLNEGLRIFLLVVTIISLWTIFLILWIATYRENTLLAGVGLKRIRLVDFAWAIAFLAFSWAFLTGLAWLLAQIGLPLTGELGMLIPEDATGRLVWVGVSFSAGFCEEVAFRGYLMTRLRLLFRLDNWIIPVIVSSVVFGICHAYQGVGGPILIGTYGLLFSLLYLRTGTLWPGIIAHSFQDLMALFFPQ